VHEALRDLAGNLVKFGVWIEVTDPNHLWSGMVDQTEPPLAPEARAAPALTSCVPA